MSLYNFFTPDDEMFCLWRAVFALVHVDGDFSDDEKAYIEKIFSVFSFSSSQIDAVNHDLEYQASVADLFFEIESDDYKRQFFIIARTIVWCDGFLHDLEVEAINKIVKNLGQNADKFQKELRWINRKPIINEGQASNVPQEDVMETVINQMVVFYKEMNL